MASVIVKAVKDIFFVHILIFSDFILHSDSLVLTLMCRSKASPALASVKVISTHIFQTVLS